MPTTEQVQAALDAYVKAFSTDDREGWLATFAADARQEDPVGSPVNVGRDAIGGFWDNVRKLAERYEFDVRDRIVCGSEAVMTFTMKAWNGDSGICFDAVDVITVDDDGLISSLRAFWDPAQMRPI